MPRYAVVEFEDKSCEVVPCNWIHDGNKFTYWPNYVSRTKLNDAVLQSRKPDKKMWQICKIRLLHYAATMSAASRMAKKLEDTSNIESDETSEKQTKLTKRVPKTPRRLIDEAGDPDNSSTQQSDGDFTGKSPLKKRPVAMRAKLEPVDVCRGNGEPDRSTDVSEQRLLKRCPSSEVCKTAMSRQAYENGDASNGHVSKEVDIDVDIPDTSNANTMVCNDELSASLATRPTEASKDMHLLPVCDTETTTAASLNVTMNSHKTADCLILNCTNSSMSLSSRTQASSRYQTPEPATASTSDEWVVDLHDGLEPVGTPKPQCKRRDAVSNYQTTRKRRDVHRAENMLMQRNTMDSGESHVVPDKFRKPAVQVSTKNDTLAHKRGMSDEQMPRRTAKLSVMSGGANSVRMPFVSTHSEMSRVRSEKLAVDSIKMPESSRDDAVFMPTVLKMMRCIEGVRYDVQQLVKSTGIMMERIENLMSSRSAHIGDDSMERPDFNLPLSSDEDLYNLEQQLHDRQCFRSLVMVLTSIGGSDVNETVRLLMKKLLRRSLAIQFSFEGRQGKKPFCQLILCKAVFAAVRGRFRYVTDKEIGQHVGRRLARSVDTEGGRKYRFSAKRQPKHFADDYVIDDDMSDSASDVEH